MRRLLRKRFYIPAIATAFGIFAFFFYASLGWRHVLIIQQNANDGERLRKSFCGDRNPIKTLKKKLDDQIDKSIKDSQVKEREIIRHKKVEVVYKWYRDAGTLYSYRDDKGVWHEGNWWVTPKLIYDCIIYGEKYRYLSKSYFWDTLDPENMYICYCANGFNFCTFKDSKPNWNGSRDHGIGDINDCNLYLFPDKGKGRDMYDMEKSIKVLYTVLGAGNYEGCWIIWNKFRPDVRQLYFKLKEVK